MIQILFALSALFCLSWCVPVDTQEVIKTIKIEQTKKTSQTQILENYITQINLEENNKYINNLENILIRAIWKFKELKLFIEIDTEVLGWKQIKIPESYYIMFDMWNSKTPRVLYSSRIAENRLDITDIWIFNWSKNPQSSTFDLKNSHLAKPSKEWIWKVSINFVEILNKNSWLEIPVSLYIWDWDSLIQEDINKRIFAIIKKAYFEYSCEDWNNCKIEVLN